MRRLSRLVFLALLSGCEVVDPAPPEPPLLLTIELSESVVAMVPGQIGPGPTRSPVRAYVEVTVARNGFVGEVTLTAEAPAPIVAVIPLVVSQEPTHTTILQLEMPEETAAGNHLVTVRATAGKQSVANSLTLEARPFLMHINQPNVTVSRGATRTTTLFFTKAPTTAVTVTPSSPPPGITITAGPAAGNPVYLDITANDAAPLATHSVTITASAMGVQETRELAVSVQAPLPKREIAFRLCRSQVIFFSPYAGTYAYANDGEGWTTIVPDADDVFRFHATERVSFANIFDYRYNLYSGGPVTRVIQATATELEAMTCAPASNGSKSFEVAGTNATTFHMALGGFWANSGENAVSRMGAARPGPHDLVAVGARAAAAGLERVGILRRDLDVPHGSTLALDFAGNEAVVLDSATHSLVAPAGDLFFITSRLHTPTTIALLDRQLPQQLTNWYWGLPESLLRDDDIQSAMFTIWNTASPAGLKGVVHYFRAATPLTPMIGPDVALPTIDLEEQSISLPYQSEYPDLAGTGYILPIDFRGTAHLVELWQTKGFVGGAPSNWVFRPPDLGRFRLVPALSQEFAAVAAASGGLLAFGGTPASGSIVRWAIRPFSGYAMGMPFPAGRGSGAVMPFAEGR